MANSLKWPISLPKARFYKKKHQQSLGTNTAATFSKLASTVFLWTVIAATFCGAIGPALSNNVAVQIGIPTKTQIGSATAMVVAGLTFGVSNALGVKMDPVVENVQKGTEVGTSVVEKVPTFFDRMQSHAIQVGVSTSVQVATGQVGLKDAFKQGAINIGVNAVGALGANQISKLYDVNKIPLGYLGHKLAHFGLGGAMGLAMNHKDPLKGFLSGGISAFCAEIMAESLLPQSMSLESRLNIIKLTSGTGAFLAGGDVNLAVMTSSNAFNNNSLLGPHWSSEAEQQAFQNREAGGEHLMEFSKTEIPYLNEKIHSGCDALNDWFFKWLPGITQENRSLMEPFLLWNMGADLIPTTYGGTVLTVAPIVGTMGKSIVPNVKVIGQGVRGLFSKGGILVPELSQIEKLELKFVQALEGNIGQNLAKEAFSVEVPQVNLGKTFVNSNISTKSIHKNSLGYVGETHVYSIEKISDKEPYKIGISSQGVRKSDGKSIRAESQARKLQRQTGEIYETKIRKSFQTRKEGYGYEEKFIKKTREMKGEDSLPGNKNDH